MSVPRGNGQNGGHFYSNVTQPVEIECNFVVDSTNGNGLGQRSLKSNGYIQSVFMHTTATPAAGNPNPAAGVALIRFNNNFNKYLGGFSGFVSPVTGSALTATVNHVAYIITSLGTATLAQWQAVGFPAGFTPAVGAPFVATASATIGGSATVKAAGVSGVSSVEVIGDSNSVISNSNIAANGGAQVLVQFLSGAGAVTAPADGSVVGMAFLFDGSSVTIDGL